MSNSNQTNVTMEESLPLKTIPGSGDMPNNGTCLEQEPETFSNDKHHRKLAICSIICGISCIGIKALTNSVKAEHTKEPKAAAKFSQKAKKFGIIAIVAWITLLASIPILMALVSYLFTLVE